MSRGSMSVPRCRPTGILNRDRWRSVEMVVYQCQRRCGVYGDTSRTSPLQGHITVLTVTVCHTAKHYDDDGYDD